MLGWLGFIKTNISSSLPKAAIVTVGELASLIHESFCEHASTKHEGQSLNHERS